ncbi:hypothetical protein PYR74_18390 [Acinetobacter bereziniae]|nr:hypothetical protein PYR74_18390 [Acinetobacter bereziniae]
MKSWVNQGFGRKDGVHFSEKGYQKLGQSMANDLIALLDSKSQITGVNKDPELSTNLKQNLPSSNTGFASICLEGNKECKSIRF